MSFEYFREKIYPGWDDEDQTDREYRVKCETQRAFDIAHAVRPEGIVAHIALIRDNLFEAVDFIFRDEPHFSETNVPGFIDISTIVDLEPCEISTCISSPSTIMEEFREQMEKDEPLIQCNELDILNLADDPTDEQNSSPLPLF